MDMKICICIYGFVYVYIYTLQLCIEVNYAINRIHHFQIRLVYTNKKSLLFDELRSTW